MGTTLSLHGVGNPKVEGVKRHIPPAVQPHPFMIHVCPVVGKVISPCEGRLTLWMWGNSSEPEGTSSSSFTSAMSLAHRSGMRSRSVGMNLSFSPWKKDLFTSAHQSTRIMQIMNRLQKQCREKWPNDQVSRRREYICLNSRQDMMPHTQC